MMLSIMVGVFLILGGIAWILLYYMAEGMNPAGWKLSGMTPALWGLIAVAVGIALIVFR